MAPRGRVVDRREQDRTLGAILLVRTDGVAVRAAAPACAAVPPARDTGTGRSAGRVSRKSGQERRYSRRRLALFRSEEHTSELQSLMRISYAVFCLTKKKSHHNMDIYPPTLPAQH